MIHSDYSPSRQRLHRHCRRRRRHRRHHHQLILLPKYLFRRSRRLYHRLLCLPSLTSLTAERVLSIEHVQKYIKDLEPTREFQMKSRHDSSPVLLVPAIKQHMLMPYIPLDNKAIIERVVPLTQQSLLLIPDTQQSPFIPLEFRDCVSLNAYANNNIYLVALMSLNTYANNNIYLMSLMGDYLSFYFLSNGYTLTP
jgi:hypothetical protein